MRTASLLPALVAANFVMALEAANRPRRFALLLADPPMAEAFEARQARTAAAVNHRARIAAAQTTLRAALAELGATVTGSTETLLNAVYVAAPEEQAASLSRLPGVVRVEPMLELKRHMIRAPELVNAPQAWSTAGGASNAGAGVRIAILDTGIDQEHAAFQDASLAPPSGFPKCRQQDCGFTNGKVIAARSYVEMLVLGEDPRFSRPDDLSARDRVGHGTATAMVAAGVRHNTPLGVASGVAPKAWLGNYKIFGSPGVNDVTFDDVVIRALEDALNDGMDIAVLSIGRAALFAPTDTGSFCGRPSGTACDPRADAVENAIRRGLTVVISAGNDGDLGIELPTLNSIHTPGTALSAITVGATTNAQVYESGVLVEGGGVPAGLGRIPALFGDGPKPDAALRAPLGDVSRLEDNGRACSPLANGSLAGVLALIERGDCAFATKVNHAQRAGALGVVLFQRSGNFLFRPTGLSETGIPLVLIGSTAGAALKSFLAANPGRAAALDPAVSPRAIAADEVAFFSSQGPNIGGSEIKPELTAVGRQNYVATQRFDPNGDMYDASGFVAVEGTSFAGPMVAGGAALVKQRNPRYTPAQIKSAVVNTAIEDIVDYDYNDQPVRARTSGTGAGKLDASQAVRVTLTAEPATLSFGVIAAGGTLPSRGLRITNTGTATANVRLEARARDTDRNARVTLSQTSFSLAAGGTAQLTARLDGTRPPPGSYEGFVVIEGGAVPLKVPYLYLVGDGVAFNAFPLRGFGFIGNVNESLPGRLAFKVVDRYGVPVNGVGVRFRNTLGNGVIEIANDRTDVLGIAEASRVFLGPQLGEQEFIAEAGGLTVVFPGRARLVPVIRTDGVVNAASGRLERGMAPGSYASIFGRNLSESFRVATTAALPLSLAGVSVSFDEPARRLSLPGRIHFVSDGQINVQVPWELEGLNSAMMKVSIGDTSSALYTVPLNDYSPAMFEFMEALSGRLLAASLDAGFTLITSASPARRNQFIQLYANGLGPVDNPPPTGQPAPPQPLSPVRVLPVVTFGGRAGEVLFAGLAPFNVGLYQVNVRVPPDAPTGTQPVVVTVGGVSSKPANLPIQ